MCMAYRGGGSVGRRILRNGRAIVLREGRLCKWGGAIKGWLTPTISFEVKQHLVKANLGHAGNPRRL